MQALGALEQAPCISKIFIPPDSPCHLPGDCPLSLPSGSLTCDIPDLVPFDL